MRLQNRTRDPGRAFSIIEVPAGKLLHPQLAVGIQLPSCELFIADFRIIRAEEC